jgi:xylan 1,4-beta-xylosidase
MTSESSTAQSLMRSLSRSVDSSHRSTTATLQVDWQTVVAPATPFLFGSNDYEITKPEALTDGKYKQILKQLDTRLIRIHHAELSDRWSNATTQTWNEAKLKTAFDAFYPHHPTLIQNIPRWPQWMRQDKQGMLDPSEYDRYANFCADLVRILNIKQQRGIQFWEPLNERDDIYEKAGKLNELWKIYNQAATAMKAVDPTIKIGGPVLIYDASDRLESFLPACKSHVDFISWHRYASGDAKESTDSIMDMTPQYGEQVRRFREITSRLIPNRPIPLLLGEYNINYTWDSGEERQNTHIGAVWFASVLKHLGEAKIDMAASWHLKDGIYGMIDPENNLRPAATVFEWGRQHLIGKIVKTQSNHRFLEGFAVQQDKGGRSLLLINKSAQAIQVNLTLNSPTQTQFTAAHLLSEQGVKDQPADSLNPSSLNLPAYSLLLLRA